MGLFDFSEQRADGRVGIDFHGFTPEFSSAKGF